MSVTDTETVAGEWGLGPPFSTQTRYFQTTWDSTSLGWIKDCPRYYYYQMIEGWAPQGYNIHLTFGSLYAYGVEHYARYRADGFTHDVATLGMIRAVLGKAGHRDPETDEWVPWDPPAGHPDANIKNRYTLIRSLVWNVEDRLSSPYRTLIKENGRPAVEESFNFYAFDIDDEPIHLAGHLDEVVEDKADGSLWVADDKTTKGPIEANYFRQYSPHNQVSLYSVAGKVVLKAPIKGVLIRAAQIGVTFTRFAARPIPRPPAVLDEWFNETQYWIGQAKSFAELEYWPMNDKSCLGGQTEIKVSRGKMKGRKTTLKKFHDFFHSPRFGEILNAPYVLADIGGHVGLARVVNVLKQGVKQTYKLDTNDATIFATADHRFKTPNGWKELRELKLGEELLYWNARQGTGRKKPPQRTAIYSVPYHPFAQVSCSKGKNYKRLWRSRVVVEAHLNGLSEEEFVHILRKDEARAKTLEYLPMGVEVHHRDRDCTNDAFDNLEVMSMIDHKREHEEEIVANVNRFSTTRVVGISLWDEEETYDLVVENHHNFIAEGLVAHNCGNFGGCPFIGVCSKSPSHRKAWLEDGFVKREWNPLVPRGE